MKRIHAMPFGAQVLPGGGVCFRLWAPAARCVAVAIEGAIPCGAPMDGLGDGWFELELPEARPGTRYRFVIDGQHKVPDPASRFQPDDVHGASEVIDPAAYLWRDDDWTGRPWHEAVLYELHVGTFSPEGMFDGVTERLDHLVALGVTAIELMPVADYPGAHNWGYDGAYPFAPDASLGRPERLKALVEAAHERGLMVFLDVVYNHFGPEGNYLNLYAPQVFTDRHHTPWGKAINFDGPHCAPVRDFFVQNALYWLEEYGLDGLRLDAVHAIKDDSEPDILRELAAAVHRRFAGGRYIHLVLENDANEARYLEHGEDGDARWYVAQWNDDAHHALHSLLTGEVGGYYEDYADDPAGALGRALAEGFAFQGEPSPHRGGSLRGEPSANLPPVAFVDFLQNHDQVGNRAFGERIDATAPAEAVEAGLAILLLSPHPPLLFMGQEWAASTPFPFFCDFGEDLADAVREGRRREFARFPEFREPAARTRIPDPTDPRTFAAARLDWNELTRPPHAARLSLVRELLELRRREVVPRLAGTPAGSTHWQRWHRCAVYVCWTMGDGTTLALTANPGPQPAPRLASVHGRVIYAREGAAADDGVLGPWSVEWHLTEPGRAG